MRKTLLAVLLSVLLAPFAMGQTHEMEVATGKVGAPIQKTMYGLFFEDINYAADGGLYAEMVKNRSFEFPYALTGWTAFGKVKVLDDGPFERNPHYVRLSYSGHSDKFTGLENEGFFGMGLREGATYEFSVWARGEGGKIRVELVDDDTMGERQQIASSEIEITSSEWRKYETTLKSNVTMQDAHLRVVLAGKEDVDLEHISLFPQDTWKGRKGGLRKDLVQALVDIHPGVFRFPGGCIVEGTDLATRYNWKNTVGAVENRPINENRWHYTFGHRFFPDYFQSYGLGFYEFFLLCEDLGCEPLPVVSCGLACQFQNHSADAHVPVAELGPYIQDALDLIEFANGDKSTKWGSLRAKMGHEAPFGLKLLGVGNEQWGQEYPEHLKPFVDAIRKAYPDIRIVGTSGPDSEGEQFDYLWPEMKKLGVDLVDEHFYRPNAWFLSQGLRYDKYDRKGPKVFAGEYACHTKKKKWNHFEASLLEAAFMTGLERNADVVHMATYAPLFAHVKGWQWRPDLIWFDNLESVRSCSWYVQMLYSTNKGTNVVPLTMGGKPVAGQEGQDGLFASAVWDAATSEYIVKVVNTSSNPQKVRITFKGLRGQHAGGQSVSYSSPDPDADNTLEEPSKVVPTYGTTQVSGNVVEKEIPAQTFEIFKVKK